MALIAHAVLLLIALAALFVAAVALMVGRLVLLGVLLTAAVLFTSVVHLGGLIHTDARHPSAAPRWCAAHGHPPQAKSVGVDDPAQTTAEDSALTVVLH
ncbi:hypothetical protein ACTXG6_34195 [Pseudonocardia sp. Cha107L01]|uniref:hypothetical protein n=1 Tax=Pseudonocardia sp. Cha107L01 TaxID=3457576 RepID=UPI00403EB788